MEVSTHQIRLRSNQTPCKSGAHRAGGKSLPSLKKAEDVNILRLNGANDLGNQTQPVGLGRPPYLVIGFMGPVIHCLNRSFWLAPMYLENLRIGGTTEYSS